MTVLVLGGTSEARVLAELLVDAGLEVVSSLAGRVSQPRLPVGEVRLGGFGGVPGLVAFLADKEIVAVVDATHPFARTISDHAIQACDQAGVPLLRLARPGWSERPDAAGWHWVDDHAEAAALAASLGSSVLLTTGRQTLQEFTGPLAAATVVARTVDPPETPLPSGWTLVADRGPYTVDAELQLMRAHEIKVLVTKDSGGSYTEAKLEAAQSLGVAVVVVRRPAVLLSEVASVSTPTAAADWVRAVVV